MKKHLRKMLLLLLVMMTAGAYGQVMETLIDYPEADAPVKAADATDDSKVIYSGSTALGQVKIHMDVDKVDCIQLKNGYTSDGEMNGNHIKLVVDGGFKTGDVITIAGFINNSDASKRATAVLFVSSDGSSVTKLNTFSDFINGKLVEDDPVEESYTLENDYDELYLGRDGGTTANISVIRVERPSSKTAVYCRFSDEELQVNLGEEFEQPTFSFGANESETSQDIQFTFSSSNENVATVTTLSTAPYYQLTIQGAGKTEITASFPGDDNYGAAKASFSLMVLDPNVVINYPVQGLEGLTLGSNQVVETTVNIHLNTDPVECIQLKSGYSSDSKMNGNHIQMEVTGGFKAGDVLTIAGFINNTDQSKRGTLVLFASEDGESITKLNTFDDFINSRFVEDDPVEQEYVLEDDYDVLYLGRDGNTGTNVSLIVMRHANNPEPETVTITIPQSGYASFSCDQALDFTEVTGGTPTAMPEVTIYKVVEIGEKTVEVQTVDSKMVPAGTGVILQALPGEYNVTVTEKADELETLLVGTAEEPYTIQENETVYKFGVKDGKPCFAKAEAGDVVAQGKAFLRVADAGVNIIGFDTTAIDGITAVETDNAPAYNMAGQRVNNAFKGIVIKNGKKFINK